MTDNRDREAIDEVREAVYPGQLTDIVLSKTNLTALGPPYSPCNETKDYRQMTCIEACINTNMNKAMEESCGCEYPEECGSYDDWTEECQDALFYNWSPIESICNLQCLAECNQVSFTINRIDVEWDISQSLLDDYKDDISANFNITRQTDDEIKKRMTRLSIYFSRFETTEISQSPSMTPTNLVGNVGGLLGK